MPSAPALASLRRKAAARLRAQSIPPAVLRDAAPPLAGGSAPFSPPFGPHADSGAAQTSQDDDPDWPAPHTAGTSPSDLRPAGLRSGPAPAPVPAAPAAAPTNERAGKAAPAKASAAPSSAPRLNFFGLTLRPNTGPAAVLSAGEIGKLRAALSNLLRKAAELTDDAMTHTNRRHATAEIWSTLDDQEIAILVDFILERGETSIAAAQVARGLADLWDRAAVAAVLGPKLIMSVIFYRLNGGIGW